MIAAKIKRNKAWAQCQHSCKLVFILATDAAALEIKSGDATLRRQLLELPKTVLKPFSRSAIAGVFSEGLAHLHNNRWPAKLADPPR
jgi:hypothetical protein